MSEKFIKFRLPRRIGLCVGAIAALFATVTVPLSASAANPRVLVDQGESVSALAHVVKVPSTSSFDLALRAHDAAALSSFLTQVSTPSSTNYRQFLSAAQFAAQFGVRSRTLARVSSYFSSYGLHVTRSLSSGLLLHVSGPTASIERAFAAKLIAVRRSSGVVASQFHGSATLPSSIAHALVAVAGLSTWRAPHALSIAPQTTSSKIAPRISTPSSCDGATTYLSTHFGEFSAQQQAAGYGLDTQWTNGDNGAGENIAVYELSDYRYSDLSHYWSCYGIAPSFSNVNVDGGTSDTSGQEEANLDIEEASVLAPGASVTVYTGPNAGAGPLDVYAAIANADTASVVTTSWGACERKQISVSDIQSEQTVFAQMAAQGQSIFASAGDEGSSDCAPANGGGLAVDDPASQPLVTGVGGLSVSSFASVSPASTLVESVWNDGVSAGGAGGGGISTVWPQPSWQSGTTVGTLGGRGVPDLSVMADPNTGFVDYNSGRWGAVGGTSIGSPILAAITATADQVCATRLGSINPTVYEMGDLGIGLNDVTSGSNAIPGKSTGGLYVAKTGYDLASGFGSPDPSTFISGLCQTLPSATNSSVLTTPASGPVDLVSGAQITLTVRTAANSPVQFAAPTVSASQSGAHVVVSALSALTDANGTINYLVSSNRTGVANLQFTMGNVVVATSSVTFRSSISVHTAQLSALGGVASTLSTASTTSGQRVAVELSSSGHLLETAGSLSTVTDLSKKLKLMSATGAPAISCDATSCLVVLDIGGHVVVVRNANTPSLASASDLSKSSSLALNAQGSTSAVVDSRDSGFFTLSWLNKSGQTLLARWSALNNKYSVSNLSNTLGVPKASGRTALVVDSSSKAEVAVHVGSGYRIAISAPASSVENVTTLAGYDASGANALVSSPNFVRDPATGVLELAARTTAGRLVVFAANNAAPDVISIASVVASSGVSAAAFASGLTTSSSEVLIYLTSAGTQMALQIPQWSSVSVKVLTGAVLPGASLTGGPLCLVVTGAVAYVVAP
jgi:kumamolisin